MPAYAIPVDQFVSTATLIATAIIISTTTPLVPSRTALRSWLARVACRSTRAMITASTTIDHLRSLRSSSKVTTATMRIRRPPYPSGRRRRDGVVPTAVSLAAGDRPTADHDGEFDSVL